MPNDPATIEAANAAPAATELHGIHGGACTCHAVRQAARRVTGLYDAAMAPHGLRISQFSLLVRLRRSGPVGVRTLAAALGMDRTTLGRNLRPLERDGLLRSEADPGDRRVRRVALTDAGLVRLRAALPAWREVQAAFEAGYGAAETALLHEALSRVAQVRGVAPSASRPRKAGSVPGA